jgi:diaminohydroxyphosphoribosylaminopyrimidine deaminase/5-amino-6-(5-phosphoribosylamino)uracil reductase
LEFCIVKEKVEMIDKKINYKDTMNQVKVHEAYMRRAIELAKQGTGAVNPNPLVGAVIVKDGRIIGEGYHRRYGELHAEREAFAHLTEAADGAEMYVTLEPCCHYGKQPPCVNAIIEHGIKRVFVGSDDPNVLVSGGGYKILREAGIQVVTHVLKEECDSINDVFFHYIVNKTPYVVMKYAMTMDGKLATYTGESKWITGEAARHHVMEQRNGLTGIMVGIGTVLKDNPMLTCRIEGGRNPVRIVCDSNLNIPLDSNLVTSAKDVRTIVATCCLPKTETENDSKTVIRQDKYNSLCEAGVEIIETDSMDGHVNLVSLMKKLGEQNIDGILLEGGGTLNYSALQAGIVNEVNMYIAPKIFGGNGIYTPVGGQGVRFPDEAYKYKMCGMEQYGEDVLLRYKKC